ncbi:MAG TPA: NUDIX domain-containing protein [Candidatus Stackebrandtia faecavium]|nr:NUDIX domain-containing protein [Candidatus Stackebrandtia faecavium]
MKPRAVAVVVRAGNILVMHRSKPGTQYFNLPGGGIEPGETAEHACARELREETGLDATAIDRFLWTLENRGRLEHYFLVSALTGEPRLGGPEAEICSPTNMYRPTWLPLDHLSDAGLVPAGLATKVLATLDD